MPRDGEGPGPRQHEVSGESDEVQLQRADTQGGFRCAEGVGVGPGERTETE